MLQTTRLLSSALTLALCILTNYALLLPPPKDVTMESINMRHVLKWRPQQSTCSTTTYSAQFQGDFELKFLNGRWEDAPECQQTTLTECDLTLDLGSDSDYNVRVRAECGNRISPWSKLTRPFNRKQTILTVPDMTVTTMGDSMLVTFRDLPVTARVTVTVWKGGEELRTWTHVVSVGQTQRDIPSLQEGAVYCVRAQTHLGSYSRSSNSTETQCVTISDSRATWLKPAVSVGAVMLAGLTFALFWSLVHCKPEAWKTFFRREPLPTSLQICSIARLKLHPGEACEPFHIVMLIDQQTPESERSGIMND